MMLEQRKMKNELSASQTNPVPFRITKDIMPGVVCLLQGVWPNLDQRGIDQAGAANILTSTVPTEPCMGSQTHSVLVEVELCKI